jgi:hypothetical protein
LKAHVSPNEFYGHVGQDQTTWGRPENMTTDRPAFKIDTSHPGNSESKRFITNIIRTYPEKTPQFVLHVFVVLTWDLDLEDTSQILRYQILYSEIIIQYCL